MTPVHETVVVLGASTKQNRYSNYAVNRLSAAGYNVVAVGSQPGAIGQVEVVTGLPSGLTAHTVSVYLRPELHSLYEDWLLSGAVRRVIFNPGAENAGLKQLLESAGVEVLWQCSLVMISTGEF